MASTMSSSACTTWRPARRIYTRLGFTVSPRGRHLGRGTANYCMMLDADYLELRGIVDASQFTDDLDRFLERGEGLNGVVFSTPDADACLAALRAAEVDVLPPMDVSRLIDLPDEEVSLRFKLLHLLPEATPGLHAIISQHLTLDLLRRPDWLSHANGARSVSEVTVVMADLKGVADSYAKLFGAAAIVAEGAQGHHHRPRRPQRYPVGRHRPHFAAVTMRSSWTTRCRCRAWRR